MNLQSKENAAYAAFSASGADVTASTNLADNIAMQAKLPFTDVPGALEEFKAGRMIVVVDDEDRENEGDLTMAAEKITPEAVNFMAKNGRGLICLALTEDRCDDLALPLMSPVMSPNWM